LRAKQIAGSIIVEGIQRSLDSSISPVFGNQLQELANDGGPSSLFEKGDMRAFITFAELKNIDAVDVGIFNNAPKVEKLKSFNHNVGDTLPQRRFIAAPNQRFDTEIMKPAIDAVKIITDQAKEDKRIAREVLVAPSILEVIEGLEFEDIT